MKAVQINRYGNNEVVEINKNATKPVPGAGQLLIEVNATSINPVDLSRNGPCAWKSGYKN